MRLFILIALPWLLLSASCRELQELTTALPPEDNRINFQSPQVGQESRYLAFEGLKPYEQQPVLRYLNDTLVVRITGQTGAIFQIEEYQTSEPAIRLRHSFEVQADTLFVDITPRSNYPDSWLFNAAGRLKMPLKTLSSPVVPMQSWNVRPFYQNAPGLGMVLNYEQFGTIYNNLTIYHDYSAMTYDGPGYYFLYSKAAGVVRTVYFNPWQGRGLGWDLLPE